MQRVVSQNIKQKQYAQKRAKEGQRGCTTRNKVGFPARVCRERQGGLAAAGADESFVPPDPRAILLSHRSSRILPLESERRMALGWHSDLLPAGQWHGTRAASRTFRAACNSPMAGHKAI